MEKPTGKKIGANRVNIYATERCINDLEWIAKTMDKEFPPSRSRVIRILAEQEVARRMKSVGRRRSAVR